MRYEAKIIIGNYLCEVDNNLRFTTGETGMVYYEDSNFIGFEVLGDMKVNYSSVQALGKVAKKFKSITGQDATVRACLYSY